MALRRQYETVDDIPPFARTVGAAKANDIVLQVSCPTCHAFRPVDLDRVIAARGPDYSFINKRFRCTLTFNCKGWVRFSHSGRGVMRKMETPDFIAWWEDRERQARDAVTASLLGFGKEREEKRAKSRR